MTPSASQRPRAAARRLIRLALAAALGVGAALLVSCGSSGKGLIPMAHAGPLLTDFEAVRQAAENGDCSATDAALAKTEEDFAALPSTVDSGLRSSLRQGIENLKTRAQETCEQSQQSSAATSTTQKTTPPVTTPKTTSTATTTTTTTTSTGSTTPTTTTTTTAPGGTPAPEGEAPAGSGGSPGEGAGAGGTGAGGQSAGTPEAGK